MPRRLVNYFRGFEDLTMKARMARNIIAFCEQRQLDPFSHMPESFVVQPGAASDHPERQRFMQREAELKNSGCAAAWIAKSTHGAKGDNICIRSNVADIFAYVDSISDSSADEAAETTKSRFKRNKPRPAWLVQRYIARPLLIHGHKFDIRVWALLTHDYRVYLYRDGVCRLAAAPFVADSFDRDGFEFAHLTNHCIAARHADYGKLAPGNEMFFQDFQRHLAENASLWTVQEHLMPQISDIVGLAFRSVREVRFFLFFLFLNSFKLALRLTVSNISLLLWSYSWQLLQPAENAPGCSFQLFGFDLMLDADFHLNLLEVNATPAVAQSLLTRIVTDIIELAIQPAFEPARTVDSASSWIEVPMPTAE
jgi:tubulin--tyrosine ligase